MARKKPRDFVLIVRVRRDGVLIIEIGVSALAVAALHSPFAYDALGPTQGRPEARFRVTDHRGFARDVARALVDELGEDGSTIITNAIDKACESAVEDGSQYWVDDREDSTSEDG